MSVRRTAEMICSSHLQRLIETFLRQNRNRKTSKPYGSLLNQGLLMSPVEILSMKADLFHHLRVYT